MRRRILISILFPLFFIIACYSSPKAGSHIKDSVDSKIDDPHEYLLFLDESESILITKYGEPDWGGILYGGDVLYYKDLHMAFGLDREKVSSILLYRGMTKENIKIGMSQEEVIKTLNAGKIDFCQNEDLPLTITYNTKIYEYYLNFYDGVLEEILIKLKA